MSSNIKINRICENCSLPFIAKTTVTKYCGDRCAKQAYKSRKRKEKIKASNNETKIKIQHSIIELQAKEFLTIAETCLLFSISRTSVWRAAKRGEIETAKIGNRVLILKNSLSDIFEKSRK